jgi:L,D-peptidoglycan transpeptidase YkuD (ErfK/YbiS/YcfS/YnhG family)
MPLNSFDRAAGRLCIAETGSTQRLSVLAHGSATTVTCLEKDPLGLWAPAYNLGSFCGFVGRNGITAEKSERDGCTPAGQFRLGGAFGVCPNPGTKMAWRAVTPDSRWVDDPESTLYNTWVEAPDDTGWSSAEHLIDFPLEYAYAVIVGYNTDPVIPGKGSAIFLHCGTQPTSGCIAVAEADLLRILAWLEPSKLPEILIRPKE